MRTVKILHKAHSEPIDALITYSTIPRDEVPKNLLDPIIFLNHRSKQHFKTGNRGLPFGLHAHRPFETAIFILQGDLIHRPFVRNTKEEISEAYNDYTKGLFGKKVQLENNR